MRPQFQKKSHPARDRLLQFADSLGWVSECINSVRAKGPHWPNEIYAPLPEMNNAMPEAIMKVGGVALLQQLVSSGALGVSRFVDPLLTLATWRMTQGIYRIDPAVYEHIVGTPLDGGLPAEVLARLPEWCIFVETPGLRTLRTDGKGEVDVLGVWARQDIEPGSNERILAIAPLVEGDAVMAHQYLYLRGNVQASIDRIFGEWQSSGLAIAEEARSAVLGYVRPVINLLLYIASSADDISRRGKSSLPENPRPKKTRRDGWKIFPAPGPVEWDVGVRMGSALRAAFIAACDPDTIRALLAERDALREALTECLRVNETDAGDDVAVGANAMLIAHAALAQGQENKA